MIEIKPGDNAGGTLEIGWIRICSKRPSWHRRLLVRIGLWFNRLRGKDTIAAWSLDTGETR